MVVDRMDCKHCGQPAQPGHWLPKAAAAGVDMGALFVYQSTDPAGPCEVDGCTERWYGEVHHIAPKAIFGEKEADRWPTVRLCRRHHEEWHRRMGLRMED